MTLRSSQLDANELDQEFLQLLQEGIQEITSRDWRPEIETILDFIVFSLPIVGGNKGTAGALLYNLVYVNNKGGPLSFTQKWRYAILRFLLTWPWKRGCKMDEAWSEEEVQDLRHQVWKGVQKVDRFIKTLSFLSFLVFLVQGRFRSVLERVLGLSLSHNKQHSARFISHDLLNRQLVWKASTEFFLSVYPLLQASSTKRYLKSFLFQEIRKKTISLSSQISHRHLSKHASRRGNHRYQRINVPSVMYKEKVRK
jgi:peroxin-2